MTSLQLQSKRQFLSGYHCRQSKAEMRFTPPCLYFLTISWSVEPSGQLILQLLLPLTVQLSPSSQPQVARAAAPHSPHSLSAGLATLVPITDLFGRSRTWRQRQLEWFDCPNHSSCLSHLAHLNHRHVETKPNNIIYNLTLKIYATHMSIIIYAHFNLVCDNIGWACLWICCGWLRG